MLTGEVSKKLSIKDGIITLSPEDAEYLIKKLLQYLY
ncbi:hypothetical protein [Bacillus sp. MYb56]